MYMLSSTDLIQSRAFRRALLFVIGIGAPALAAIWLRESNGLLLGVITALMFGFADDEGSLARRLTALGRSAAGMAIGGAVGHLLGGYGPLFWLLFVGAAFGAAWLNRSGKTAHIGARLAVMALAITAGSPELTRTEVLFVIGALALAVLARLADHAAFGPLPPSSIPLPPRAAPENDILWLRYAAAYAAAAAVGLWLGLMIDPHHAIWVAITTLVVMQPDDRRNYRRIVERVLGTALGVVVAYVLTRYVLTMPLIVVALLVTAAVMPHHIPIRYWLHTAAIALLVLLAYNLASHASVFAARPDPTLFSERLVDVFVGSLLALLGTVAAFPWSELRSQQAPG
jgi:hypothetical protein